MHDLPHSTRASKNGSFRASDDEMKQFRRAARSTGRTLSNWIRHELRQAAKRVLARAQG